MIFNLNGEKSYLIHLELENAQSDINSMINFLVNKRKWSCIYICVNKSYKIIKKKFEKNGYNMEMFFFIDAIEEEPKEKIKNVHFVSSPSALTKIALSINQIIQQVQNKCFIFIDSLEELSIYNNPDILTKFIRSVIITATKYDVKSLILTHGGEEALINNISHLFDKIIKVD